MGKISIDYCQVVNKTKKIDELSAELENVNSNFQKIVESIPNFWDSPAAKIYIKQCLELEDSIKSTVMKMENISVDIRVMAENIKKEDEALALRTKEIIK